MKANCMDIFIECRTNSTKNPGRNYIIYCDFVKQAPLFSCPDFKLGAGKVKYRYPAKVLLDILVKPCRLARLGVEDWIVFLCSRPHAVGLRNALIPQTRC
jgi:hypothetical protein